MRLPTRLQYGFILLTFVVGGSMWSALLACNHGADVALCQALADEGHEEPAPAAPVTAPTAVPVETAQPSDLASLGASSLSWSGEILSDQEFQIYPARDGQLLSWTVQLGQSVTKGQVLARLAPAPMTAELAATLAELTREAEVARANASATVTLMSVVKRELTSVQGALVRARYAKGASAEAALREQHQVLVNVSRELAAVHAVRNTAVSVATTAAQASQARIAAAQQSLSAAQARRAAAVAASNAELQGAEGEVVRAGQALAALQAQLTARAAATQADLARADAAITAQRAAATIAVETFLGRTAGLLYRSTPRAPTDAQTFLLRAGVGSRSPGSASAYRATLAQLLTEAQAPDRLSETTILAHLRSLADVVNASEHSDELPDEILADVLRESGEDATALLESVQRIRELAAERTVQQQGVQEAQSEAARELQEAQAEITAARAEAATARATVAAEAAEADREFADALGALEEASGEAAVTQAEVARTAAEADAEVVRTDGEVASAEIGMYGEAARRAEAIADADVELAQATSEVVRTLGELDRELTVAKAEEAAAKTAYERFSTGAIGQEIVAPEAGVVGALFGRIGERVTPEDAVGAVVGAGATVRTVRFRIPADVAAPAAGTEVRVERLGFPLTPAKARITAVGTVLDANGSIIAEAAFTAPVTWPTRTPVRVIASTAAEDAILLPFAAVWYDDAGGAQVWVVGTDRTLQPRAVTLGRAVGDRVVVERGLAAGESFVARAEPSLQAGQPLPTAAPATDAAPAAGGDGHDHEH